MNTVILILRILNYITGAALLIIGIGAFILYRSTVPFLIALALIAVGPVEDLLNRYLKLPGVDPAQTKTLIDQSTSLTFILLLIAAMLVSLGII